MGKVFSTIGRRLFGVPLLALGGWILSASVSRLLQAINNPDSNGDSIFTISDVPGIAFAIFLAPGDMYQGFFADHVIGKVLEMDAADPET